MVDSATEKQYMKGPESPRGVTQFSADSAGTSALPGRGRVPVREQEKPILPKKKGHILRNTLLVTGSVGLAASSGLAAQHHFENDTRISPSGIAQDAQGIVATAIKDWNSFLGLFGFQKASEDPGIPGVSTEVPTTFTPITDTKALDHATGADGTPLDQLPTGQRVVVSETIFQASSNGTAVSADELSLLLQNAVKPYDSEAESADIKMLFPVKNPGDQKIMVEKIAGVTKGGGGKYFYPHMFVSWKIDLAIPNKDSVLIMPLDGALNNAEVFRVAPFKGRDGNLYFKHIVIRFAGPDGTKYELFIGNDEYSNLPYQTLSLDSILPALADAPVVGEDGTYIPFDPKYADVKGKSLPDGTDLLETAHGEGRVSFILTGSNIRGALPFDFFSSQDEKLLYTS